MMVRLKTLLDKPRGGAWRSSVRGVSCPVKSGKHLSDPMKTKLNKELCYMAGLTREEHGRNAIGIVTSFQKLESRFIDTCTKVFGIDLNRIHVDRVRDFQHIFFYDSRLWKELENIRKRQVFIFKRQDELAASFIAGMFDSSGHFAKGEMIIKNLTRNDIFMLNNLGIKTRGKEIASKKTLFMLIRKFSSLLEDIQVPGNERDLH